MNIEDLKKQIIDTIDKWNSQQEHHTVSTPSTLEYSIGGDGIIGDTLGGVTTEAPVEEPKRELPEGKRVVRTKSSGDRVYLLTEDVTPKTRQWVTNPEVLKGLGFESSDVTEVDDNELLGYQMASAIYRVDA
jgi:hypothetical protein